MAGATVTTEQIDRMLADKKISKKVADELREKAADAPKPEARPNGDFREATVIGIANVEKKRSGIRGINLCLAVAGLDDLQWDFLACNDTVINAESDSEWAGRTNVERTHEVLLAHDIDLMASDEAQQAAFEEFIGSTVRVMVRADSESSTGYNVSLTRSAQGARFNTAVADKIRDALKAAA